MVGHDDVGDPEIVGDDVVVGASVDVTTVVVVGAIVPPGTTTDGVAVVGFLVEGDVVVGTFATSMVIGMPVFGDVVGLAVVVVVVVGVGVGVGTEDSEGVVRAFVVAAFVVGLVVDGASVNTTGGAMGDIVGPYVGTSDVFGIVTGESVIRPPLPAADCRFAASSSRTGCLSPPPLAITRPTPPSLPRRS